MEKKTDKKYYWKMDGRIYEVTKKQYAEYRKDYDRHKRLKQIEKDERVEEASFDSLNEKGESGDLFLADPNINVEEEVIHKMMLEKLRTALDKLTEEELFLIDLLYSEIKSEREIAEMTGKSQNAIHKRKKRILRDLKKFLEN